MKQALFILLAVTFLIGCGAGHSNLTSITVSPQTATATSSPQGQVGYTAIGELPKWEEPGIVAGRRTLLEDLAHEHRWRSGYYWLDWRSYVLGAGYCYDYRQRSSELAVHC